jgi:succinate dehydrogenase / fumarate reductase membrane anchor subunit
MRTVINDYARGRFRLVLLALVAAAVVVLIALGTLVLTTFDPCLDASVASQIPQCKAS